MPKREQWNTAGLEAIAARWQALEQVHDAAQKLIAHVAGFGARDGDGRDCIIWLDDIPEAVALKVALGAVAKSERGT